MRATTDELESLVTSRTLLSSSGFDHIGDESGGLLAFSLTIDFHGARTIVPGLSAAPTDSTITVGADTTAVPTHDGIENKEFASWPGAWKLLTWWQHGCNSKESKDARKLFRKFANVSIRERNSTRLT
jgi:hypothetical protein